jgi:small subunit ribosomal protein S1
MSWQEFLTNHHVGEVVDGITVSQAPFGTFVEIDGFHGLAFEQTWPVGDRVTVRILAIDDVRQRFSLAAAA